VTAFTRDTHPTLPARAGRIIAAMAIRITGSTNLYSSIVTTAPGGRTRIHHHGLAGIPEEPFDPLAWWCTRAAEAAERCLA